MSKEKTNSRIIILWGHEEKSETYEFGEVDKIFVGRSEDNDICLPRASVSSKHCLFYEEKDSHYVTDRGSTNGTRVNGEKISEPTKLLSGDIIKVGEVELAFESGYEKNKDFTTTVINLNNMGELVSCDIENLSPFHKKRKDEAKITRTFYYVLGLLGFSVLIGMFFVLKSVLFATM